MMFQCYHIINVGVTNVTCDSFVTLIHVVLFGLLTWPTFVTNVTLVWSDIFMDAIYVVFQTAFVMNCFAANFTCMANTLLAFVSEIVIITFTILAVIRISIDIMFMSLMMIQS